MDNAWVYRSGLIIITTGYFHHVISNDDELAAVLGHEIAHNISQHSLESETIRLADEYFTNPFALLSSLMAIHPIFIFCAVPVMLSTLKSLSLSRTREREADYIGLLLMADAVFDPRGAVSLWTKFNKWEKELQSVAKKGIRQDPQFKSTHPHVSSIHLFDGCLKSLNLWLLKISRLLAEPSSVFYLSWSTADGHAATSRRQESSRLKNGYRRSTKFGETYRLLQTRQSRYLDT